MKAGFFSDTYHPQVNGVVTAIDSQKNALEKEGVSVAVFAPLHGFPSLPFPLAPEYRVAFPFRKVGGFDLIHFHTPYVVGLKAIKTAQKQGLPLVGTFHTLPVHMLSVFGNAFCEKLTPVAWKYLSSFYKNCDCIISPGKWLCTELEQRTGRRVEWVSNGISLPAVRREKRKKEDGLTLLHVGRVSAEKKIEVLLKALKILDQEIKFRAFILSDGPARRGLESLAKSLKLDDRVVFTGYLPKKKVLNYYQTADAVVVPSTSEIQSLVQLEALAYGKPLIAADAEANKDFVTNNKNGFLFKKDDPRDLAEKILQLKSENLKKLGGQSLCLARQHSVQNTAKKLKKIYESL